MDNARPKAIGRAVPRREDRRLIMGEGRFVADISPDDVLHVAFARSPSARGRIVDLELTDAAGLPGVVAVFSGADVRDVGVLNINPVLEHTGTLHYPVLAGTHVMAVGQPVAAVLAESAHQATDAAEAVFFDIDEYDLPAPPDGRLNGHWQRGNVDAAFARADHVVTATVRHPRLAPAPLETRGIVCDYDRTRDIVTVWYASQTPHRARSELARMLGVAKDRIVVIAPDVGGAFGMKASLYPEEVFTVWASLKLKRSTRWIADRWEDFLAASHGRGTGSDGRLALSSDGRFLALQARANSPLGHWLPNSAAIPAWNAGRIMPGGYDIPAVDITTTARQDHTAPVGIYRGAGRPEANCLMERLVDEAARVTGLDPVTIRQKNMVGPDMFPHALPSGASLDSGDYGAALGTLAHVADYDGLKADRDRRQAAGELVGLGLAFYVEPCGSGWESARVTLNPDGTAHVASGSSSQGHGRETAYAQIAADALGLPVEKITVSQGSTADCPTGIGALASRSTAIGGSAVLQACEEALNKSRPAGQAVSAEVVYDTAGEAWGYGAYLIVLSIDRDTGVPTVEQAHCIDDAGTVINPVMVAGQIAGGFAQGLGEALHEAVIYDDDGQLLTGSFMDYGVPRAKDVPLLEISKMVTPSPNNPLGAKGVGEAGTIGAPAAILNAAIDALAPLNSTDIDQLRMPLTPYQLWRLIRSAS